MKYSTHALKGKKYITTKSTYTMETLFISGWIEDEERQRKKKAEGKIKQEKRDTYRENDRGKKQIKRNLNGCRIAQRQISLLDKKI